MELYRKVSIKERYPKDGIKTLFLNESTGLAEWYVLYQWVNIYNLDQDFTHWMEKVKLEDLK